MKEKEGCNEILDFYCVMRDPVKLLLFLFMPLRAIGYRYDLINIRLTFLFVH